MTDGRGDIAASNIPIIPELQKYVDFSDPVRAGAKDLVVTGPAAPSITTLDDLAGKEIFVRKLSRYWPNLEKLNEQFKASGKPEMTLKVADQNLQDEDILDMVNAGLVGITVMDDLIAGLSTISPFLCPKSVFVYPFLYPFLCGFQDTAGHCVTPRDTKNPASLLSVCDFVRNFESVQPECEASALPLSQAGNLFYRTAMIPQSAAFPKTYPSGPLFPMFPLFP